MAYSWGAADMGGPLGTGAPGTSWREGGMIQGLLRNTRAVVSCEGKEEKWSRHQRNPTSFSESKHRRSKTHVHHNRIVGQQSWRNDKERASHRSRGGTYEQAEGEILKKRTRFHLKGSSPSEAAEHQRTKINLR